MYNNPHTTDPISISITMHGRKHTIEGINWDADAEELIDIFLRLLIGAGFCPDVLNRAEDDGHWEFVDNERPDKEQ